MSDSLQPHRVQHTRLPCPSLSPRVFSNSCPLSQWCCLTISSSIARFSSCLQSFPASGSFPVSRLFKSGGQSIKGLPQYLKCILNVRRNISQGRFQILKQGTLCSSPILGEHPLLNLPNKLHTPHPSPLGLPLALPTTGWSWTFRVLGSAST